MSWRVLLENPAGVNLSPDALYGRGGESERALRSAFNWLTRTGAGRHFGSMPIGWYQQHQIAALEILQDAARKQELLQHPHASSWLFRFARGGYQVWDYENERWVNLNLSPRQVFERADRKTRSR